MSEKEFDLEKAIMAAFTRRALSTLSNARERSVEKTINNIAGMIKDHLDYERNKLIDERVAAKTVKDLEHPRITIQLADRPSI